MRWRDTRFWSRASRARSPGRPRPWLFGFLAVVVGAAVLLVTMRTTVKTRSPVLEPPATLPAELADPGVKPRACAGVRVPLGTDLQAAVDANPEGVTLCLQAGTYRLSQSLRPKRGQRLYGQRRTSLSGAKRIAGWTHSPHNGWWWHDGDAARPANLVGRCADGGDACMYPDDVWRDGVRLRRVLSLAELVPGAVYVDYAADRLYLRDDPTRAVLELSATPWAILSGGGNRGVSGVVLAGLTVEKFASPAQTAAVQMGPGWMVDGVEVRDNHGIGITVGSHSVLRRSRVHRQGQLGVGGSGTVGALVEGNEIDHNNTAGYDGQWEAGGGKWVLHSRDLTVRGNYVHHNDGQGLWTDTDNVGVTYEDNLVRDNTGSGIFHETSYTAVIRGNDLRHNAEAAAGRSIWHGADILLNDAQNVEIDGNTVVSSSNGIGLVDVDRGGGRFGTYRLRNVKVHDNLVTMTAEAQTGAVGASAELAGANTRFSANSYRVPRRTGEFWQWGERSLNWDQWRRYRQDVAGSLRTR